MWKPMGKISKAITAACKRTASAWLESNFSFFDQMSLTLMGLIPGGRGGCFGGEKKSLMRVPNPPKPAPHFIANLLLMGRFPPGADRRDSARLPKKPAPKEVCVNGASLLARTLMGRSVRNCLRLDQKSSGTRIAGRPNLGTYAGRAWEAWLGGLGGCEPVAATFGFGVEG